MIADMCINASIDGRKIVLPFFIIDIDNSLRSEQHGIAAIAGRHYAIEHINAQRNTFQYVPGRTHAHEVTGLVGRQVIATQVRTARIAYCQVPQHLTRQWHCR